MLEEFKKVVMRASKYTFSKKNATRVSGVVLLTFLDKGINIALPLILKEWFESNEKDEKKAELDESIKAYLLIGGISFAFALGHLWPIIRSQLINGVREEVQLETTKELIQKCYHLELNTVLSTPGGQLAKAIVTNYNAADKLIPSFWNQVFPTVVEVLAVTAVLTTYYGLTGIAELTVLLIYIASVIGGIRYSRETQKELSDAGLKVFGELLSATRKYEIAHQFNNIDYEMKKVATLLKQHKKRIANSHTKSNLTLFTQQGINIIGFVAMTLWTSFKTFRGSFEYIDTAMIFYYYFQFTLQLEKFSIGIKELSDAIVESEKIIGFIEQNSSIQDRSDATSTPFEKPPIIEFKNVSFRYPNQENDTIKRINFRIDAGKTLAIVGPTGSGKTTLLNLLLRFYNATEGKIKIDEKNINKYKAEAWRQAIAVVSQNSSLFFGTVKDNIQYGYLDANEEEIKQVARYAELIKSNDESILEQKVGENDSMISGGQRQRVAIARALLKGGLVYFLDEIGSALDSKTDQALQKTIQSIIKNKTAILVSHKLYNIVYADHIIYLNEGSIVEEGTYQELMKRKGEFYSQFILQCKENQIKIDEIEDKRNGKEEEEQVIEDMYQTRMKTSKNVIVNMHLHRQQQSNFQDSINMTAEHNEQTSLLNLKKNNNRGCNII